LGVANLRGGFFGIVDLARFLRARIDPGADSAKSLRADGDWAQCRLVALNPSLEAGCALLIDRLMGLRTPQSFVRSETPPDASPDYYGHVYTDAQQRRWQEINLQRLSLTPAFLSISA
jgi:twitching motility protein PilI